LFGKGSPTWYEERKFTFLAQLVNCSMFNDGYLTIIATNLITAVKMIF